MGGGHLDLRFHLYVSLSLHLVVATCGILLRILNPNHKRGVATCNQDPERLEPQEICSGTH